MGGMEIQMMIAIDFTGSNGDPRDQKRFVHLSIEISF